MCIDYLDNRHRCKQEENDFCSRSKGMTEVLSNGPMIRAAEGINRPQKSSPKQGGCGLVDAEWVFKSDCRVCNHKDKHIDAKSHVPLLKQITILQSRCTTPLGSTPL